MNRPPTRPTKRPPTRARNRFTRSCISTPLTPWKLDRFGRSLKHLVNALAELEALGVAFISLRDSIDLSTPQGKLMFAVIGAMAAFERGLIRERVKAGLAVARSKGGIVGRPKVRRERDRDAQKIRQLREDGQSLQEIADELGRNKQDIYRVVNALNCAPQPTAPITLL